MKAVMLTLSLLLLAGCEDRYRYPCQDPANWNNEECKRPQCEVDGLCPDQLWDKEVDNTQGKIEAAEDTTTAAPCEQPQPTSEDTPGE